MSMENVHDQAEEARRALGQLASAVRQRRGEARQRLDGLDREVDNVLVGARGAVRAIEDDREVVLEELDQLDEVLTGTSPVQPVPAPADDDDDDEIPSFVNQPTVPPRPADEEEDLNTTFTRDQLQGMSNERLQQIAGLYGMDARVTDANRVIVIGRIIAAQRRWCIENGEEDPNGSSRTVQRTRIVEIIDVRRWSGWQWIGAIIGLVVAYLVWTIWPEWPARNMDPSGVRSMVNFLWCLAHLGIGFFGGAIIGARLEDRQVHTPSRT